MPNLCAVAGDGADYSAGRGWRYICDASSPTQAPTAGASDALERLRRVLLLLVPAPARPRKRKRKKPRDFQRTRVYRWEAAHVLAHAASL